MKDCMNVLLQSGGLLVLKLFYEVILKLQIFCAHIFWNSITLRVLSSANYIWYILSHVCVVTIVTYVLWHISRPWGRGMYWHILKRYRIWGGEYYIWQVQQIWFSWHQKLMPMKFQGFSNELNIFIWNLAGTYCAFLRWSKTPKKGRGILVWGKFYPFLFVSILCYFISWEPFNIFSWNFAQLFLV